MSDYLKFWKLKEWLTADQAAHLISDRDPCEYWHASWQPIYEALNLAYEKHCHIRDDKRETDIKPYEGIFTPVNIKTIFGRVGRIDDFEIRQAAIPEWLSSNGIESDYFSLLDYPVKTEVIARPEYQTALMVIMYATIERYYGENYDPDDRDTVPKQIDVIGWIRKKYSISEARAKAVDKMTRPN
jgi:hypothetical protein